MYCAARSWLFAVAVVAALSCESLAASFEAINGTPHVGRSFNTHLSLSADGRTVAGSAYVGGAFLWTREQGITLLSTLPAGSALATITDIDADGSTVLGQAANSEWLIWDASGATRHLPLTPAGISNDALIVVGAERGQRAVRWDASRLTLLDDDLLPFSNALDVSADGDVIVGWVTRDSGARAGFRWEVGDTELTPLDPLPRGVAITELNTVSFNGKHALGFANADGNQRGVILRENTEPLLLESLQRMTLTAISDDGNTVVGRKLGGVHDVPFIWDPVHGMRDLQDVLSNQYGLADEIGNLILTEVHGLSADGRTILGKARVPGAGGSFTETPWIATVPEPSTMAMTIFSALGLVLYRAGRGLRATSPTH